MTAFGRAGSALLVHTRGNLGSLLIEEGTQGPWGHVAICDGTGWVYQAMSGGFDVVTESSYAGNLTARVDVPLTDAQRAAAMAWCEGQLQRRTRYNWPAIFIFPLRTIRADVWLGPVYRRLARWAQNRDALICSEAWINMLEAVGFDVAIFGDRSMRPKWRRGLPILSSEISPNAIGLVAATQALYYRLDAA